MDITEELESVTRVLLRVESGRLPDISDADTVRIALRRGHITWNRDHGLFYLTSKGGKLVAGAHHHNIF